MKRYLTDQRLDRCFHRLALPDRPGRRVREIAEEWGFFNPSHFNRLFRQRFGVAPSHVAALFDRSDPGAPETVLRPYREDIRRLCSWLQRNVTD